MALEEIIQENTAAVKELIAVLKKGGAAAPAASGEAKRGPGRPPAAAKATKHTAEAVKAAIVGVKDALGSPAAKQIIADHGGKDLADLLTKKDKFDDVMEACEAAMADEPAAEEEEDGL